MAMIITGWKACAMFVSMADLPDIGDLSTLEGIGPQSDLPKRFRPAALTPVDIK